MKNKDNKRAKKSRISVFNTLLSKEAFASFTARCRCFFGEEKNKRRLRYILYLLFLTALAVIVSISAVKIKHRIVDHQLANTPSNERLYSAYYNSLSYREQLLYDSITIAAENLKEESEVIGTSYTMNDLMHIISCIRADRADLFYVCFDDLVLYNASHKTKIGMVYIDSKKDIKAMRAEYSKALEEALKHIDPSMTEFEKEVALTDYITDNCIYTSLSDDMFESTSYGALVKGQAMCDGYAYAVKELLTAAHIDTMVVFGSANGTEHVWNMVNIDSNYFHLDVTWNDNDSNKNKGLYFHGYFNMSDEEIRKDHSFDNSEGILPKAGLSNNYYKQISCHVTKEEELENTIYHALKKAVKSKKGYIELEYTVSGESSVIAPHFSAALNTLNEEYPDPVLKDAFRIMPANTNTNAVTIQINYNN